MSGIPGHAKIDEITEAWMKVAEESLSEEDFSFADKYIEEKLDELIHEQF
jgi:hypothetical protein